MGLYGLAVVAALNLSMPLANAELPAPKQCSGCPKFRPTTRPWQIQLQGRPSLAVNSPANEVDGADTNEATVRKLGTGARRSICYINAGAWEGFRSDRDDYSAEVLGKTYEGYPDERWLDIRRIDLLAPVLAQRTQVCREKGFDAVDPDNLDGFENETGFPLTAEDQLRFNTWLANMVHANGLAVGLKNDGSQVKALVAYFDFAVIEECFEQGECAQYQPFVRAGKAAYAVEYRSKATRFCRQAEMRNFSLIFKRRDLRSYRLTC